MPASYFSLFAFANKAILEFGTALKVSKHREIRGETKMFLNRALNNAEEFEKQLHKNLGPELAHEEDELNSALVGMIYRIFDLPPEERDHFFQHMENWEPPSSSSQTKTS